MTHYLIQTGQFSLHSTSHKYSKKTKNIIAQYQHYTTKHLQIHSTEIKYAGINYTKIQILGRYQKLTMQLFKAIIFKYINVSTYIVSFTINNNNNKNNFAILHAVKYNTQMECIVKKMWVLLSL